MKVQLIIFDKIYSTNISVLFHILKALKTSHISQGVGGVVFDKWKRIQASTISMSLAQIASTLKM